MRNKQLSQKAIYQKLRSCFILIFRYVQHRITFKLWSWPPEPVSHNTWWLAPLSQRNWCDWKHQHAEVWFANGHWQSSDLHQDYTGLNLLLSPMKVHSISTPSLKQSPGKTDTKRAITPLKNSCQGANKAPTSIVKSKALKSRLCQPSSRSSSVLKSLVLPRSNWHR